MMLDTPKEKWEAMGKKVRSSVIYRRTRTAPESKQWDFKRTLFAYLETVEGWIVGFRNIPVTDVAYDEWTSINTVGSIHVALIATSPFKKPVYVPLDAVKFIEDGE